MADAFHIGFDQLGLGGVLPVPANPYGGTPPTAPEQINPTDPDWSNFPEARSTSKGPDGEAPPTHPFADFWTQHSPPPPAPAQPDNADVIGSTVGVAGEPPAGGGPAAPPQALGPEQPGRTTLPLTGDQQMQEWLHPTTPEGQRVAHDFDAVAAGFKSAWENDTIFGGLQNATSDAIGNIVEGAKAKLGVTLEDPTHGGYLDEAVQRVIAQRKAQSWGSFFNPLDPEGFFGGGQGFKDAVAKAQMDIFDEKRQALAEKIQGDQAYDRAGENADAMALLDPDTHGSMLGAKLSHQANVAASQAVAGGGLSARIGEFAGGAFGAMRDPVNDLALMAGGGIEPYLAKTYFPLAPGAARIASDITEAGVHQALINMGLTAIAAPEHQMANEQRGEEAGLVPFLHDLEDAGIAGFVPGALIHGVKALGEMHGPDSKAWVNEFVRQARGEPPDGPITAAGRKFMDDVHQWERENGHPEGWSYSDTVRNRGAAPSSRAAEEPGRPQKLLGGPDFPKSPDLPSASRNRPSPSSITPEAVASAEADHAAMPPALLGVPPSEHARVYTEAVRHGEAPDVMAPPEPPMSAPPAADANFLPPDHHPEVPARPPGEVFEHAGKPVTAGVTFRARDLRTDAITYQYKAGGDGNGVTDRLSTVRQWSPLSVGNIVAHERLDGHRYIVDGHQRLGLANRLMDGGQARDVSLPGFLFKEDDGWTPEDVRAEAAAKNIREGLGDTLDIARILRDKPEMWDDSLPIGRSDMKEARGLAALSDEAWHMALNGKPRRDFASFVGNMAPDPSTHLAIMDDLVKFEPRTQNEARMIIADSLQAGFNRTQSADLFGTHEVTESLRGERSKVYAAAERLLTDDKKIFGMLEAEAPRIIEAGNVLADTNAERADRAGQLAQGLITLARRAGPVSAALNRAAQRVADGEAPKTSASTFLNELPALLKEEGVRVADVAAPPKYDLDTPKGREEQVRDLEAEFMETQPGMFAEPPTAAPTSTEPARAAPAFPTNDPLIDHVLSDPYVASAIADPVINRKNDVPYGAGPNNANDRVVNTDRHVPKSDTIGGVKYDPARAVAVHEQVEKHVLDQLRAAGVPENEAYEVAHFVFAEPAERAWVEANVGHPTRGFETAKGSTYQLHEDGTTTRNKSDHSGGLSTHEKTDVGVKERSAKTVYVDAKLASALSAAGLTTSEKTEWRVAIKDGKATLISRTAKKKQWGASPESRDIAISTEPEVGKAPLELWKPKDDVHGYEAYSGMHAGNKITKMTGVDPWSEYQKHWDKWLKPIDHENPANPPPDLYQKPYPHDDDHLAPEDRGSDKKFEETGHHNLPELRAIAERALGGQMPDLEGTVRDIAREATIAAKASPDPLDQKIGEILERDVAPLIDEVFPPAERGPAVRGVSEYVELAYLRATGGAYNARARLADMRAALAFLPRETVDAEFRRLQTQDQTALMALDNPREITPRDKEAAINVGGEPRHILYAQKDAFRAPPATEAGPEGTQQTLMPGVAPVTDADRARLAAAAPLRGGDAAPPAGGLFDEVGRAQGDLLDMIPTDDGLKTRQELQEQAPHENVLSKLVGECDGF